MLSGMTDLHRELERRVAKFLNREDAMLFNSGFGGALGTISGLLRKSDVAILDNRSHLSLRDGAIFRDVARRNSSITTPSRSMRHWRANRPAPTRGDRRNLFDGWRFWESAGDA